MGMESVKTSLKPLADAGIYQATVSARFFSLAQLPLIKETRIQFLEAENRNDLLLEMELATKGDFNAEEFSFTFQSTDEDAAILEHYPPGKLDKEARSVTWANSAGFNGRVAYKVHLQGRAAKKIAR